MTLTGRDTELLQTLACHIKALTAEQWHRERWPVGPSGRRECDRRISLLESAGLLVAERALGVALLRPVRPLVCWAPGTPRPDLDAVAASSAARWAAAAPQARAIRYLRVTSQGAAIGGGVTCVVRPSECGHDLSFTECFFSFSRDYPKLAERWESERMAGVPARGVHGCDALIRTPGRPIAIEMVGQSYSAEHLHTLHDSCAEADWRYQLW